MNDNQLTISIDRKSKAWAIFDECNVVASFRKYEVEADALSEAKLEVGRRSTAEPAVVYPMITKMTLSRGRR